MASVVINDLSKSARSSDVENFFQGFGRLNDISLKSGYAVVEFDNSRDADDAVRRLNGRRICDDRVSLELEKVKTEYRGGGGGGRDDRRRDDRDDRRDDRGRDRRDDRYDDRRDDRRNGGYNDRRGGDRYGGGDRNGGGDRYGSGGGGFSRGGFSSRGGGGNFRGGGRSGRPRPERTKFGIVCKNLSQQVNWMDLKDMARQYGGVTFAEANKDKDREGIVTFSNKNDMMAAYKDMDGKEFFGKTLEVEYEFPETCDTNWDGEVNNDHPLSDFRNRRTRQSRSRSPDRRRHSRSRSGSRRSRSRSSRSRSR